MPNRVTSERIEAMQLNERIADMWVADRTMSQIADEIGITLALVKTRIRRMQEIGEIPPARATWSEENVALLRQAVQLGCSDEAIARELGCSVMAVISKRRRLQIRRNA